MAFKRVQHTEEERQRAFDRMQDRTLFRGRDGTPKKIHRITATINFRERTHSGDSLAGDIGYRAEILRDNNRQQIEVRFPARRGMAMRNNPIQEEVQAEHERLCDEGNFDGPIQRQMILEGCWTPRKWNDRNGVLHTRWDFVVAEWHYRLSGSAELHVAGEMPVLQ